MPDREKLITGYINEASDTHPLHIKLDEKLKDPNAAAIVNYLNEIDLKFLQKSITEGDRTLLVIIPDLLAGNRDGKKVIVTNSVTKGKE
ncbi:hypothetical protein ARAF_1649 [Arsenophonus endosymbiont of Aleurodicus floccissimus]|uniref:hypothetical protein n=1 Tax=Arsenophonus endosymbiont of Aleurodicus floccissimus TaxID=2152761 RepID=UPI000E6B2EDC|nr:hypothetical protein [Arsenophonus endosymbiont of Aleurodicus floccissimus]SPP31980.1 hypothetical protein ARAF_1649 [Arsenophonus endosymbiont of Aleurodicus floccissimus]